MNIMWSDEELIRHNEHTKILGFLLLRRRDLINEYETSNIFTRHKKLIEVDALRREWEDLNAYCNKLESEETEK